MTSESWFAIDSDDSPLRNRKITTVVLKAVGVWMAGRPGLRPAEGATGTKTGGSCSASRTSPGRPGGVSPRRLPGGRHRRGGRSVLPAVRRRPPQPPDIRRNRLINHGTRSIFDLDQCASVATRAPFGLPTVRMCRRFMWRTRTVGPAGLIALSAGLSPAEDGFRAVVAV